MKNKDNKPMLSCMSRGPGPAYKLPPLIGYVGHDPSRYRNPAYTIPGRLGDKDRTFGPGPQYDVGKLTKYGRDNPPAYTLANRENFQSLLSTFIIENYNI